MSNSDHTALVLMLAIQLCPVARQVLRLVELRMRRRE